MSIQQPLADQIRPETLDQIVGQKYLLSPVQTKELSQLPITKVIGL